MGVNKSKINTSLPDQKECSEPDIRFYERLIIAILKQGKIPRHIAFIMDGNRRYATARGQEKTEGHSLGLQALKRCMQWCFYLGIKEVSIFAFALDNFKRSKEEVDVLMNLAQFNLRKMADQEEFFDRNNVKVNICGDISTCPESVQKAMNEIQEMTAGNSRLVLNICFAYNSSQELERCTKKIRDQVTLGELEVDQISVNTLFENMYIKTSPDLLVRTSNEIRLSNFLTFQSTNSQIIFIKENWPEISIFSMLKIIIQYQLGLNRQIQLQQQLEVKQDNKVNNINS